MLVDIALTFERDKSRVVIGPRDTTSQTWLVEHQDLNVNRVLIGWINQLVHSRDLVVMAAQLGDYLRREFPDVEFRVRAYQYVVVSQTEEPREI